MSQEVTYGKKVYDFLSSVKLGISLLLIIAASSVLGTIIKQGGTPEEYVQLYTQSGYRIIKLFGLDDVFRTWWFILLLFLFALNLFTCSLKRLERDLRRNSKETIPPIENLRKMRNSLYLSGLSLESVTEELKKDYKVLIKEEDGVCLEKWGFSRYGVHFIHFSIIIILLGSLLGLLFGLRGFVSLKKGEEKSYVTLRGKNPEETKLDFLLRCKDFRVDFYADGTPKDYVTEIEILKDGEKIMEKRIRVNEPLKYEGYYFYQASYGKEATFYFEVDGRKRSITDREVFREDGLIMRVMRYEPSIHDFGPGVLVAYLQNGHPETTWFLRDVQKMRLKEIGGKKVEFIDVKEDLYTVLEVTKDPGIYIVWSGFSLLLFGLFTTFFLSPRKVYLRGDSTGTWVAVHSEKRREDSERELKKIGSRFYAQ